MGKIVTRLPFRFFLHTFLFGTALGAGYGFGRSLFRKGCCTGEQHHHRGPHRHGGCRHHAEEEVEVEVNESPSSSGPATDEAAKTGDEA